MKKILFTLILSLSNFCFIHTIAYSQNNNVEILQIGDGNNQSNNAPISAYYHYSYSQQLYTADEFFYSQSCDIVSLSFNYYLSSTTTRDIQVYLMNTDETELSNNFLPISDATLVYSGIHTFSNINDNWSEIVFDVSFEYTGSNVLVVVLMNRLNQEPSDYNYNNTSRFYCTEMPNMCHICRDDNNEIIINADGTANFNPYSNNHPRPNIRFGIDTRCPKISNLNVSEVSANGGKFSWSLDKPDKHTAYNIAVIPNTALNSTWNNAEFANLIQAEGVVKYENVVLENCFFSLSDMLFPARDYTFFVQNICQGGAVNDTSSWSSLAFRTLSPCNEITNISIPDEGLHYNSVDFVVESGPNNTEYGYFFSTDLFDEVSLANIRRELLILANQPNNTFNNLSENTQYYIYARGFCENDGESPWYVADFTTIYQCPAPHVEFIDSTYNGAMIRIEKHLFGVENEWQIRCLKTEDNSVDFETITTNNNNVIYGLQAGSDYVVEVMPVEASCPATTIPATISFSTSDAAEPILAQGDLLSRTLPIEAEWGDAYTHSQSIYPAEMLTPFVNSYINSLTYYSTTRNFNLTGGFELRLGITEEENFSANIFDNTTETSLVYTGSLAISDSLMTINFETPFLYEGGNLLVDFRLVTPGTYRKIDFFRSEFREVVHSCSGHSATSYAAIGNVAQVNTSYDLPKMKVGYLPSCNLLSAIFVEVESYNTATVFYIANENSNYELYISEEPINPNKIANLEPISVSTNTYTFTELSENTKYYLAVKENCGDGNFSNIVYNEFTTHYRCSNVQAVVIEDISQTTASVFVTKGADGEQDDAFNYRLREIGTEEWTYFMNQPASFTFTGLQEITRYEFQVQALCEAQVAESGWTESENFATACGGVIIAPYTETFESNSLTASCWTVERLGDNNTAKWKAPDFISYSRNIENLDTYIISPAFVVSENQQLSYRAISKSTSNYSEHFTVYISTTTNDIAAFSTALQEVTLGENDNLSNTQPIRLIDLRPYAGQTVYFAFRHHNCSQNILYIEEVGVEQIPACETPRNITVTNITKSEATIGWTTLTENNRMQLLVTNNPVTSQEQFYSPELQAQILPISTNPFTITNLTPSTQYYFYLRNDCGDGLFSDLTFTNTNNTFVTKCEKNTIPYSLTSAHTIRPETNGCWDIENPSNLEFSANVLFIEFNSRTIGSIRIISPEFTTVGHDIAVEFSMQQKEARYFNGNGNMEDETLTLEYSYDGQTWHAAQEIPIWVEEYNSESLFSISNAAFDNQESIYFAWRLDLIASGTFFHIFTPINIIDKQNCPQIENFAVVAESVTGNSATVTWNDVENNNYDFIITNEPSINLQNATPTLTDISLENFTYTFTDLQVNTNYFAYIRSRCDEETTSDWVGPASFNTPCGTYIIDDDHQYINDFEVNTECWSAVNDLTSSNRNRTWQRGNSPLRAKINGDYALIANNANDDIFVTPKFSIQTEEARLKWKDVVQRTDRPYSYKIILSHEEITVENYDNCMILTDIVCTNAELTEHELPLGDFYGQEIYIGFYVYSGSTGYAMAIDDFIIKGATNQENDILTFSVDGIDFDIDTENHTITGELPFGFSSTYNETNGYAQAIITISEFASIIPESGSDFVWNGNASEPLIYTVTAENGNAQEWTVTAFEPECPRPQVNVNIANRKDIEITASDSITIEIAYSNSQLLTEQLTLGFEITLNRDSSIILTSDYANTYYIYVRLICNETQLGNWEEFVVTTESDCLPPTNLQAEETDQNQVTLTWDAPEGLPQSANLTENFDNGNITANHTITGSNEENSWLIENGVLKSNVRGISNGEAKFIMDVEVIETGELSFKYRNSSENGYDFLTFYVDNQETLNTKRQGGDFQTFTHQLEAGLHTLEWKYKKDGSVDQDDDCAYIDDIVVPNSVKISQYIIYKNGVLLDTIFANNTTYTDSTAENGSNCYKILNSCDIDFASDFTEETCIEVSSCNAVTNLAEGQFTGSTLELTWTANSGETAWQISYSDTTYIIDATTENLVINEQNVSYLVPDISPCNTYEFTISPLCYETPGYENTIVVTAPSVIFALPYYENFDTEYNSFPCWQNLLDPYEPQIIGSEKSLFIQSNSFSTYGDTAIILLPYLQAYSANQLRVKFNAAAHSQDFIDANGKFDFGYYSMLTQNFTAIEELELTTNFQEFTVSTNNAHITDEEQEAGIFLAFRAKIIYPYANYGVLIDNVLVEEVYDFDLTANACTGNYTSDVQTSYGNIIPAEVFEQAGTFQHTYETNYGSYIIYEHVNLTINQTYSNELTDSACGEYVWEGYTLTESGDYYIPYHTQYGCDSTSYLHLTIFPTYDLEITDSACESYIWNDTTILESGSYTRSFQTEKGCDSIVTLHLTINHSSEEFVQLTQCRAFTWHGQEITQSGTYFHDTTNASGCQHTIWLEANVQDTSRNDFYVNICDASVFRYYGRDYPESGDYERLLSTAQGCDSLVVLHISYNPGTDTTWTTINACESYTWQQNDTRYTESGDYVLEITSEENCSRYIGIHLNITNGTNHEFADTACDSYTWNEQIYTETGTYRQVLSNENGCDSIVTLHLTVNQSTNYEITETACDFFNWNDSTYTESGDYSHVFVSENGCGSVVTLHLTISPTIEHEFSHTTCNNFTWNDSLYAESGDFVQTFQTEQGCDSVVTLHLTIIPTIEHEFSLTTCNNFTWNDSLYVESGDFVQTFQTEQGCDSVVTLHLTIIPTIEHEFSHTTCNNFTWNDSLYTESGVFVQTFQTEQGCDSVVTLHLTIIPTIEHEFSHTTCNNFTWNDSLYTESGDFVQTFQTEQGCDSVVTLHLTVNYSVSYEFDTIANDIFEWNDSIFTETGDYTITLQTAEGCDSVVTVHLTIETTSVDNIFSHELSLYPNPTSDIVNIVAEREISKIEIISINGQQLASYEIGGNTFSCDLSNYKPGTYIIRVRLANGEEVVNEVIKR